MKAMVLLIFAYGGFESALAPMSEAKNPARDAGFCAVCGTDRVHCDLCAGAMGGGGSAGPGATTDRPLAEVARVTMGNRGAGLVAIGALVSVYGYLSAKLLGMPRVTFALAKGGDLPGVCRGEPQISHAVVFDSVLSARRCGAWRLWELCLECDAVGGRPLVLLRSGLRRADRFAAKAAAGRWFPAAGRPLLAVLGVGICRAGDAVDLSKSLILGATVAAALLNWLWARRASNGVGQRFAWVYGRGRGRPAPHFGGGLLMKVLLILACYSLSCVACFAQREAVLKQIDLPHPYYFREMYLPQLTTGPSAAAWSPDSYSLVYSMAGSLWRQELRQRQKAEQLTAGPGYDYQPDWSSDGRWVVFARYDHDAVELWSLDARWADAEDDVRRGRKCGAAFLARWQAPGIRVDFL
jgi:hypothetical protein